MAMHTTLPVGCINIRLSVTFQTRYVPPVGADLVSSNGEENTRPPDGIPERFRPCGPGARGAIRRTALTSRSAAGLRWGESPYYGYYKWTRRAQQIVRFRSPACKSVI